MSQTKAQLLNPLGDLDLTGQLTGVGATFTGNITAVDGIFSGNVSVAGTLTKQDVTNVDSVGLITARSGINVTGGNVFIGQGGSGANNAELKLQAGAGTGNDIIAFLNQAGVTKGNITYDTDNNFMMLNVNAGEKVRISSEGRVGIATAAPQALFDLVGNEVTHMVDMGSGVNIDCSLGNFFLKTVGGSVTFDIINLPAHRTYSFSLLIHYNSGSITWPSVMVWPDNSAPTLTTGKKHLIMGVKCPDGTNNYRMSYLVNYAS